MHVLRLHVGSIALSEPEAHHARNVLRLRPGEEVELFDDQGNKARAVIERCDAKRVTVGVPQLESAAECSGITVAAAVPKGERADWMMEKLSELGIDRFIPLQTARSVVVPSGKNKIDRWNRIAIEASKQSRRTGVMRIDPIIDLAELLTPREGLRLFLSTEHDATPFWQIISDFRSQILLLIGPEGGWTDDELHRMRDAGLTGARLMRTILRTETAAVVAAALVATRI